MPILFYPIEIYSLYGVRRLDAALAFALFQMATL